MTSSPERAAARRDAAIQVMHRHAFKHGFHNPPVREELRDGVICFIGTAPNGREYAVGYMAGEGEQPSSEPFPPPPARFQVPA